MKYDWLFVLLLINVSGNPAVYTILDKEPLLVCILVLLIAYWQVLKPAPVRLNLRAVVSICGFSVLLVLHYFVFGSIVLMSSIGFMVMLLIALFTVKLVPDFYIKYISIMVWLAILSLMFHVPKLLGVNMVAIFSFLRSPLGESSYSHIYIHNFHDIEVFMRNSGIFWEPGAFAGYLVLAMLLAMAHQHIYISKWKFYVLVVALLSTLSTSGYVAFFFLFSYGLLSRYRGRSVAGLDYRFVLLPFFLAAIIGIGVYSYDKVEFLGEKIEEQIQHYRDGRVGNEINRFGNLMYDIKFILERPLTGWSATPQTRAILDREAVEFISGQGNGLSGFMVRFGLIGFFLYFYSFYKNFKSITRSRAQSLVYMATVILLLMAEQYLNYPLFFALIFSSPSVIVLAERPTEISNSQDINTGYRNETRCSDGLS